MSITVMQTMVSFGSIMLSSLLAVQMGFLLWFSFDNNLTSGFAQNEYARSVLLCGLILNVVHLLSFLLIFTIYAGDVTVIRKLSRVQWTVLKWFCSIQFFPFSTVLSICVAGLLMMKLTFYQHTMVVILCIQLFLDLLCQCDVILTVLWYEKQMALWRKQSMKTKE